MLILSSNALAKFISFCSLFGAATIWTPYGAFSLEKLVGIARLGQPVSDIEAALKISSIYSC